MLLLSSGGAVPALVAELPLALLNALPGAIRHGRDGVRVDLAHLPTHKRHLICMRVGEGGEGTDCQSAGGRGELTRAEQSLIRLASVSRPARTGLWGLGDSQLTRRPWWYGLEVQVLRPVNRPMRTFQTWTVLAESWI